MANNGSGGSANSRRLFSPTERARLLALELTEPTGFTVELGGVTFDLHPLTTEQGKEVFDLVGDFAKLQRMMKAASEGEEGSNFNQLDLAEFIAQKGDRIMTIARDVLKRSAYVGDEDIATFDEWFGRLPLQKTIKTLIQPILAANGFAALSQAKNQPTPTETETETGKENLSTPETQSDSLELITATSQAS